MENPQYYDRCLKNLFGMVVEVNARIRMQDLGTAAAKEIYDATQPGHSYAETSTCEERAWIQLCRAHGNTRPRTDYDRIEFLLSLCASYQGHTKTKRALLKELHRKGVAITNVLFSEAAPIIAMAANFEDEITAQMGTSTTLNANVLTTGVADRTGERNSKMGAGRGGEICKICAKAGHNARDCLLFMQREGTCGHWFMHSIGIYETGCTYGAMCKKKHARPDTEPPENDAVADAGRTQAAARPISSMSTGAKRVSVMATGASPEAHGDEYVLKELTASEMGSEDLHLAPNKTQCWMKNNKIWLQPEGDEDTLCQNCGEEHSIITPCSDGGQHQLLLKNMISDLATSSKHPDVPLRWASYVSQVQASQDVQDSSVLATGTRVVGSPPKYYADRRTRKAACSSITVKKCMPARDNNMYSCLYYDSD